MATRFWRSRVCRAITRRAVWKSQRLLSWQTRGSITKTPPPEGSEGSPSDGSWALEGCRTGQGAKAGRASGRLFSRLAIPAPDPAEQQVKVQKEV